MTSLPTYEVDRAVRVPRLGRAVTAFIVVSFGFTWLASLPLVFSAPANLLP
jgi:hypothetical protein